MSNFFTDAMAKLSKVNAYGEVVLGHVEAVAPLAESLASLVPGAAPIAALIPAATGIIGDLQKALDGVLNSTTSTTADLHTAADALTDALVNTALAVSPLVKTVANDASQVNLTAIPAANLAAGAVMALQALVPASPAATATTPA